MLPHTLWSTIVIALQPVSTIVALIHAQQAPRPYSHLSELSTIIATKPTPLHDHHHHLTSHIHHPQTHPLLYLYLHDYSINSHHQIPPTIGNMA